MRAVSGLVLALLIAGGAFQAIAAEAPPSEMLKLRDPFKKPVIQGDAVKRTELEMFGVDQLKVLGVVTGPNRMRAMIATPNGKTHFVSEGTYIGTRKGVITRITPEAIRVREKSVNVLGQEESVETEILLPGERRAQAVAADDLPPPPPGVDPETYRRMVEQMKSRKKEMGQ